MNKVKRLVTGTAISTLIGLSLYAVPKAVEAAEECSAATHRTGIFCCTALDVMGCVSMTDGTDGNPKSISVFCGGDSTQTANCGNGADSQNNAWGFGSTWEDDTTVICEVTSYGDTVSANCPENLFTAEVWLLTEGY